MGAYEGRKHRGHEEVEEQFCLDKEVNKSATSAGVGSLATTSSQMDVHDSCSSTWHDFFVRQALSDKYIGYQPDIRNALANIIRFTLNEHLISCRGIV